MSSAAVETISLQKRFGRNCVLDGLNLRVEQGAVFALVGPNGAGKTTTIRILLNIVEASGGMASVVGADSRALGPAQLERIGYVSEDQQLPGWMTVEQFLQYLSPFYSRWDSQLAATLIRQFHLPADRQLRHLSRGMRMKAALASSLAYRPELLILDEPFSGLDPLARDEFLEGVLENAENMTVLVSSHDLSEIESCASHIGYLDEGKLRISEETQSLAARFREVEVTLGDPAPANTPWPDTWLQPQTSAAVVRFVDSHYDATALDAHIRAAFPNARSVDVQPMALRGIFVALARTNRKAA